MAPKRLKSNTRDSIEHAAREAVESVGQIQPTEMGKGGYYRLYHLASPADGLAGLIPVMPKVWLGGKANWEKAGKYEVLSAEKAIRLGMTQLVHRHIASFQSANEELAQYQGAVLVRAKFPEITGQSFGLFISSFSGLPARFDEQVALYALGRFVDRESIGDVIKATKNDRRIFEYLEN